jgi:Ca2+-binding RTX toxin-like protein
MHFSSNITSDPTTSKSVDQAILLMQDYLTDFALNENFLKQVELAFGDRFNPTKLEEFRQQWASGQFEALPTIEVRPAAEINGAIAAFSADTNTVYLSQEYIAQNADNVQAVANVVLEEIGHFVDVNVNASDSSGDEGAIFSTLVQDVQLNELELQSLKAEDDVEILTLNEQVIQIEQATNDNISGVIKWTDSSGNLHPVRESTVLIKRIVSQDDSINPIIARGKTDKQGQYEISLNRTIDLGYVEVLADGPGHFVEKGGFLGSTYTQRSKTIEDLTGGKEVPIVIGNETDVERAFSVSDAVYVGEVYAEDVRGQLPSKLEVNFPEDNSEFSPTLKDLDVAGNNAWNWDVILHEYGHSLAISDNLHPSSLPLFPLGNEHSAGISNIPDFGKDKGVQLAWSEGLANYLGIAAQHVAARNSLLPNLPNPIDSNANNPDTFYTDTDPKANSDPEKFVDWDLEKTEVDEERFFEGRESSGVRINSGEGDEAPVARILWDLADGTRELHDRVAIGHPNLYSVLKNIPNLDSLYDIWDYFFQNPDELRLPDLPEYRFDDSKIARLGAIFEEYGVSPDLTRLDFSNGDPGINLNRNRELINFKSNDNSKLPIFKWVRGNNGANDLFQILIFNNDFSEIKINSDKAIPVSSSPVMEWKPSSEEWSRITSTPGEYNIVITGSDTIENRRGDGSPATGPYWSGAYTFHVGDVAPKKVEFGALLDNGLDKLNLFQSSTNQLLSNLPLFGNSLQPSSGTALVQTFQANQIIASAESENTEAIQTQALASEINPAIENIGFNFLENLFDTIKNKLTQKFGDATEATVDQIQDAFFELLGPNGPFGSTGILKDSDDPGNAITKEDIELIVDGSIVQFNIKLGGQEKVANISLPSNIGLPWLGFEFNDLNNPGFSTPKAGIDLDYTFDLGFGIDTTTNGFFFETSPSKDLTIALTPSFPNATAKLGFLQVEAQNKGSKIEFSVDLDDGEDGNDQLTIDELNQGNWRFTPNGSADINFHLDSSIAGSPLLPSIGADLNLNWDFTQDDASPAVDFNNVELKLGTFFRNFAGPVFQQIQKVIEPIQPLIDVLDKRVPVLDTFGRGFLDVTGEKGAPDGKVTLLDIVKLREPNAKTSEFLAAVKKTSDFIKNVDELSKQDATIKLGQFDFGDFNVADPTFDRKTINLEETSEEENVVAQLKSLSPGLVTFANDIDPSGSGPQFPILTDPTQAFKLILGQPAELFKYNVPELRFKFGFEQFFPVIGPLGALIEGNLGARVKLALGFDTYGLEQTGDPLDGFYIGNKPDPLGPGGLFDPSKGRESGAELFAGLNAAAAFSAGIARGGVGGGILGTLNLFLNDLNKDNDSTKVHLNEFDPSCIFNPVTGNLSASLNAFIKVGFGFLSYTKRFNIAKATLLDFAVGCTPAEKDNPSRNNGLATLLNGGDLRLNMGSDFAKFRLIGGQPGTDGAEVFAINYKSGTANNATLAVSAFDITRDYSNVNRIIAFAGKEDDTIVIADTVFTPAFLEGDEGNDQLYGGSGNDTLKGEAGDDALFGGKGDDDLLGGDGDDYLEGGAGADTLDGGSNSDNTKGGGDTVSYKDSPVDVRFNVDPSDSSFFIGSGGDAQGDKLRNIEHIEGSNFDDRLLGDKSSNTLEGLRGNDTLEGGGGDDILLGGIGADRLDGGSGRDWTGYVASSAEVKINLETGKASSGDAEGDTLISIEDIKGSIHNDVLIGSRFNNYLDGFLGDDRIIGSSGADTLDGGEGRDWVSYETSANGVNVSLRTGQGQDGDAQGDELVKVKDDKGNRHSLQLV